MKITATLFLMFVGFATGAQTINDYEQQIRNCLDGVSYWRFEYSKDDTLFRNAVDATDSVVYYNDALKKYLIKNAAGNTMLLKGAMKGLEEAEISVVTSQDKKMRIYSWDTHTGGAMHVYENVILYSDGGKVNAVEASMFNDKDDVEGEAIEVHNVASGDGTLYLVIYKSVFSTKDVGKKIAAYQAVNSEIRQAEVFSTEKGLRSSLEYKYDYMSNYDFEKMREVYSVKLSKNNKKLYIPVVENEQMTGMWQLYNWDGSKFVFSKNVK